MWWNSTSLLNWLYRCCLKTSYNTYRCRQGWTPTCKFIQEYVLTLATSAPRSRSTFSTFQRVHIRIGCQYPILRKCCQLVHKVATAFPVESSWNVMAHGVARVGKWRENWRMESVASTLHTTSEHGVSSITTITTVDAHSSAASSRLTWRPRRFKWTRPFRRKTKSVFCACAITFQKQSTCYWKTKEMSYSLELH